MEKFYRNTFKIKRKASADHKIGSSQGQPGITSSFALILLNVLSEDFYNFILKFSFVNRIHFDIGICNNIKRHFVLFNC